MLTNQSFFHMAAYRLSVTNALLNVPLGAVQDQILTINTTTSFLVPEPMRLVAGVAKGAGILRARVNTPALRYVGLPFLAPVDVGLTVASPPNVAEWGEFGPSLPPADSISVETTHGTGAPEINYAFIWLWKPGRRITPGPSYRIRFTAAITAVSGSWVNGLMTPDTTLPAGVYEVQGMDAFGTNLAGVRLAFPGGGYRPGCLARNAATSIRYPLFQGSWLGPYGQFDSTNIPTIDIYAEAANTAQEVYLDVVRLGDRQ